MLELDEMTQDKRPIRVLVVEDSPIAMAILKRILMSTPEINVVGTAKTGKEALELIPNVDPDVICTDLYMPQMNGLEFITEVMATYPKPILVISASVQEEDRQNVFQLLKAGAVDVFPKPRAGLASHYEQARQELITKIKVLSGVSVFTQRRKEPLLTVPATPTTAFPSKSISKPSWERLGTANVKVLAIGASTGGPQALHTILTQLPANFPVPVICVQHISEGFLQGLVDWLGHNCVLRVKIATNGERPLPGTIYFPAEAQHLELDRLGRFSHSTALPVSGHRPSVTVMFNSVANYYGRSTMAVLLTGMGRDGADGLLKVSQVGGVTVAQDERTCVVFGMPKEAIALGAAKYILPLPEIAPTILRQFNRVG